MRASDLGPSENQATTCIKRPVRQVPRVAVIYRFDCISSIDSVFLFVQLHFPIPLPTVNCCPSRDPAPVRILVPIALWQGEVTGVVGFTHPQDGFNTVPQNIAYPSSFRHGYYIPCPSSKMSSIRHSSKPPPTISPIKLWTLF